MPTPVITKLTLDELQDLISSIAIHLPANSPQIVKVYEVIGRLRKQIHGS